MSTRIVFALVNVIGVVAVIGGYAWCLGTYPEHREALWGGVHGTLRSAFMLSIFPAAAGYLTFCYATILQGGAMTFGKDAIVGANTIVILAIAFLASATMWTPSSIAYIRIGEGAWWFVCVVSLWVAALSLLFMTAVTAVSPVGAVSEISKYTSVVGLAYITFHCLMLDAIVWVCCLRDRTVGTARDVPI